MWGREVNYGLICLLTWSYIVPIYTLSICIVLQINFSIVHKSLTINLPQADEFIICTAFLDYLRYKHGIGMPSKDKFLIPSHGQHYHMCDMVTFFSWVKTDKDI